jgi:hypothetical protein
LFLEFLIAWFKNLFTSNLNLQVNIVLTVVYYQKYLPVTERSKTERGSEGPGLALSAGANTIFLLEREDLGTSMLLHPGKIFRQGNLNALSCPVLSLSL